MKYEEIELRSLAEYDKARAALELVPALVEALDAFQQVEFLNKSDWLGICTFNRFLRCPGTNGYISAAGPPKPIPHAEHCPFAKLDAVLAKAKAAGFGPGEEK